LLEAGKAWARIKIGIVSPEISRKFSGEHKKDKVAKVATARTLWVPAVNNHGGFDRWAFIEIDDPWDAQNLIRASLKKGTIP